MITTETKEYVDQTTGEVFTMPDIEEVVDEGKETVEVREQPNFFKIMYHKIENEVVNDLHKDIVTCVPYIKDYTVFQRKAGYRTRLAAAGFKGIMIASGTALGLSVGTTLFAQACISTAGYIVTDIVTSPIRGYAYKKILATDKQ